MLILLGIILGNLSAIAVNAFAWNLRRKYLQLMISFGPVSIAVCGGCIYLYAALATPYSYAGQNPAADSAATRLLCEIVAFTLLITAIAGILQMRQIPAKWWQAFLALWGEIGLGLVWNLLFLAAAVSYNFASEFFTSFLLAFTVVAMVLMFLRPVCLRWARPIWQVLNEMRTRKT